ncbi:hypothetical protein V6N13_005297 [Hibiscus sabdariffa]
MAFSSITVLAGCSIPSIGRNRIAYVECDGRQAAEYDKPGKLEDNCSSFSKLVAEFLRSSSKRYWKFGTECALTARAFRPVSKISAIES